MVFTAGILLTVDIIHYSYGRLINPKFAEILKSVKGSSEEPKNEELYLNIMNPEEIIASIESLQSNIQDGLCRNKSILLY